MVYKLVPLLWYTIWLPLRTTVFGMVPFTLALLMLLLLAEVNSCGESACSNEFSPSPLLPTPRLPILSHWEEEEINHKVWLTGAGLVAGNAGVSVAVCFLRRPPILFCLLSFCLGSQCCPRHGDPVKEASVPHCVV